MFILLSVIDKRPMQVKLIKNRWTDLIIWILGQEDSTAMAIHPYIFYKSDSILYVDTIAHELVHISQARNEGTIKWLLKYIWYHIRFGYMGNPYEKEARENSRRYRQSAITVYSAYKK